MDTVVSRGRGRGRGLQKGWLGLFKPKPCLVKSEDIGIYYFYIDCEKHFFGYVFKILS